MVIASMDCVISAAVLPLTSGDPTAARQRAIARASGGCSGESQAMLAGEGESNGTGPSVCAPPHALAAMRAERRHSSRMCSRHRLDRKRLLKMASAGDFDDTTATPHPDVEAPPLPAGRM
jgi:hypothetical protein